MKTIEIVKAILSHIEYDEPPDSIAEVASRILTRSGFAVDIHAAKLLVENHGKSIDQSLKQKWNQHSTRGQPLKFKLVQTASGDTLICGISFIHANDSPDEIAAKKRRALAINVASVLDTMSDPFDFERLCSKILGLLGVNSPTVTKAARDEGVDFFGKINPIAEKYLFDVSPTVQKHLDVWLVGQAKHYPNGSAGTPDLRHLFGSVSLARANAYSTESFTAKNLILRIADPVFFLFFTTGILSNDAWNLIQKTGIVAMDGAMLSAFLADRGLGETITDSVKFGIWLNS